MFVGEYTEWRNMRLTQSIDCTILHHYLHRLINHNNLYIIGEKFTSYISLTGRNYTVSYWCKILQYIHNQLEEITP